MEFIRNYITNYYYNRRKLADRLCRLAVFGQIYYYRYAKKHRQNVKHTQTSRTTLAVRKWYGFQIKFKVRNHKINLQSYCKPTPTRTIPYKKLFHLNFLYSIHFALCVSANLLLGYNTTVGGRPLISIQVYVLCQYCTFIRISMYEHHFAVIFIVYWLSRSIEMWTRKARAIHENSYFSSFSVLRTYFLILLFLFNIMAI